MTTTASPSASRPRPGGNPHWLNAVARNGRLSAPTVQTVPFAPTLAGRGIFYPEKHHASSLSFRRRADRPGTRRLQQRAAAPGRRPGRQPGPAARLGRTGPCRAGGRAVLLQRPRPAAVRAPGGRLQRQRRDRQPGTGLCLRDRQELLARLQAAGRRPVVRAAPVQPGRQQRAGTQCHAAGQPHAPDPPAGCRRLRLRSANRAQGRQSGRAPAHRSLAARASRQRALPDPLHQRGADGRADRPATSGQGLRQGAGQRTAEHPRSGGAALPGGRDQAGDDPPQCRRLERQGLRTGLQHRPGDGQRTAHRAGTDGAAGNLGLLSPGDRCGAGAEGPGARPAPGRRGRARRRYSGEAASAAANRDSLTQSAATGGWVKCHPPCGGSLGLGFSAAEWNPQDDPPCLRRSISAPPAPPAAAPRSATAPARRFRRR
ncbi:conserved hypothetical protein [Stutzerimonas stutzeri A1501]|uniref:Uncharacterized protein n=1 Tax=Stutzerimonas stutzeri (strain A1501) TaxID=379731 RepID=A4VQ68_STUS1|nr:conserved hypothetical protein [Stutzerimonas stutzeri A1501]